MPSLLHAFVVVFACFRSSFLRWRGGCNIIPDARLWVRMHEARPGRCGPAQRWRGTTEQRGPLERHASYHLFDVKTIHGGGPAYRSARARDDGQSGAVAQRARGVHRAYEHAAQRLDSLPDVRAFNQGSTDAVATALAGYGVVRALVVGQYGEASTDVHELCDVTADVASRESWRFLGARSQAEARGYYAADLRRAWGVAFVREFARHRVSRLHFVGAARRAGRQALARQRQGERDAWPMRSPAAFAAHAARAAGAFGRSARRGFPVR